MNILLKSISSMHFDPYSYVPDVDGFFAVRLTLEIGIEGLDGGDLFDLNIYSPEWILRNEWSPKWGKGILIVREYDIKIIVDVINKKIEDCIDIDWVSTARKLARYFEWEFDDYSDINL